MLSYILYAPGQPKPLRIRFFPNICLECRFPSFCECADLKRQLLLNPLHGSHEEFASSADSAFKEDVTFTMDPKVDHY